MKRLAVVGNVHKGARIRNVNVGHVVGLAQTIGQNLLRIIAHAAHYPAGTAVVFFRSMVAFETKGFAQKPTLRTIPNVA